MLEEKLSVFPMGEKNDAYARYFVGQSIIFFTHGKLSLIHI